MPACLARKGRSCSTSFGAADGDGFLIDVAEDKAAELMQRLGFYRLRAAWRLRQRRRSPLRRLGAASRACSKAPLFTPTPGCPSSASACSLPKAANAADLGCEPSGEADYHAMRIRLGVPEGGRDYAFGDAFPHEALFDQLNGVDFAKGCYVGQEVVSRMEHRGTARKRIVPVAGDAPLPASGTSIEADGVPIGTLGSVSGAAGLGADPPRPGRGGFGREPRR